MVDFFVIKVYSVAMSYEADEQCCKINIVLRVKSTHYSYPSSCLVGAKVYNK